MCVHLSRSLLPLCPSPSLFLSTSPECNMNYLFFVAAVCVFVRVCACLFCLLSVLVSCSFTCYTMLVLLMYPPTVISYSYTCHCMADTCIYIYFAIVIYISNVVKV